MSDHLFILCHQQDEPRLAELLSYFDSLDQEHGASEFA